MQREGGSVVRRRLRKSNKWIRYAGFKKLRLDRTDRNFCVACDTPNPQEIAPFGSDITLHSRTRAAEGPANAVPPVGGAEIPSAGSSLTIRVP